MFNIRVGDMYGCVEAIISIGKQEMDLGSAERISSFIDAFVRAMQPLDVRRGELLEKEFESQGERMRVFDEFADEKVELPEFSFKEFSFLRVSPDGIAALKRAGLFA